MSEKQKEALAAGRARAKMLRDQEKQGAMQNLADLPEAPASPVKKGKENTVSLDDLMGMMKGVASAVQDLSGRVNKMETANSDEGFKSSMKTEDVKRVAGDREGLDPRLVEIVDRMLGEDFGIKVETFPDRPGFLFTVVVPQRLSDNPMDSRPVKDTETGKYKVAPDGSTLMESYYPEDRRSCAISSVQSFDVIKKHCERVRSYIVAYYQKMNRPLPEFKLK